LSAILIIKLPDADPDEASRHATTAVKTLLAPLGDVEVFTFAADHFYAHWKPLHEVLAVVVQPQMEHVFHDPNPRRKH
jgi:hypothetical protein